MAETFKNAKLLVPITTAEVVYTCPAATKAIIQSSQACNIDTSIRTLTISWTDDSDSDTETRLVNAQQIPVNTPAEPIVPGLVLEAGDTIKAVGDADDKIALTLGILEIS